MDQIIQIEIVLNFLNTLLGKASYYKDRKIIDELSALRHNIYYGGNFNYELLLGQLKDKKNKLNKYQYLRG